MLRSGARAGIFDGLFAPTEDMTELDITELPSGFPRTLAPKFDVDTGVFALLGGCPPRIVPGRLVGADFGAVVGCFVGMPLFDGVFARGGAAFDVEAYSLSRYRSPCTRNGRPYSSSQLSNVFFKSYPDISSNLTLSEQGTYSFDLGQLLRDTFPHLLLPQ